MDGSGIETRSLPFLPIISPRLMYFDRLLFTLPRTILRKRWWSRSIFCPTEEPPDEEEFPLFTALLLRLPPREDAGHEGQHVGGARLVVAVVADQSTLDD